jgi:ribosomal protein S18 acetylase RimI-like enzyme
MKNLKFELIPYTASSYDFVYGVKKTVYKKYVEEIFGEWNDKFQHEMFDKFLQSCGGGIFLIVLNDKKIGFVNGKSVSDISFDLGNICILPEYQGNGIGTKLLLGLIEKHKSQDIYLRVFKQNPAKNLYERLGFEVYGETETHFLMVRKSLKNQV